MAQLLNQMAKRLTRIDATHTVILDKKSSYLYTSLFLAETLKAKKEGKKIPALTTTDISGLINSLVEYGDSNSFTDLKYVLKAAALVQDLGVVFPKILEDKLRQTSTGYSAKWEFLDINGRPAKSPKTVSVRVGDAVPIETSNQYIEVSGEAGSGVHLEFTQRAGNGTSYVSRATVYPTIEVSVRDINIATTKGPERVKDYQHRQGDTLSCSQDSKVHLYFKIDRPFNPEYAVAYLQHTEVPEFDRISTGSPLRYDADNRTIY